MGVGGDYLTRFFLQFYSGQDPSHDDVNHSLTTALACGTLPEPRARHSPGLTLFGQFRVKPNDPEYQSATVPSLGSVNEEPRQDEQVQV